MKKVLAPVLTGCLIAAALYLSYRREHALSEGPESAVWRILEESKAGNVAGYLDCFAGKTREQLESTAMGMTRPAFSDYLKKSSAGVKGVAVYEIRPVDKGHATLTVEYVFENQNERQRLNLRFDQGRWRVESTEGSQHVQPLVPYGKPVTDLQ